MTDNTGILYNSGTYSPFSGHCTQCESCCYYAVTKRSGDSVPLIIDWTKNGEASLSHSDMIKSVEYAVRFADGCTIPPECQIGVTQLSKCSAVQDRRGRLVSGPSTKARLWGGNECSRYRIYAKVTYEDCGGHCFDATACIDVTVEDC